MTYDALGRTTSKTSPNGEPARTMNYDLAYRLTAVQLAGDATPHGFTYDALGRALSAANAIGTIGFQYDLAGQRTRMTWPDGLYVTYDYDASGNMTAIRENGAISGLGVLASITFEGLGRRASPTLGKGAVQTFSASTSGADTFFHSRKSTLMSAWEEVTEQCSIVMPSTCKKMA